MTQAHEIGHAQAIQTRTKPQYPIYIILYKDWYCWLGYTTSYSLQNLIDDEKLEDIKIIANAGKLAEYQNLMERKNLGKLYYKLYEYQREKDFNTNKDNEKQDSYYYHNPKEFRYLSIHKIIKQRKDIIYNCKSKPELYLYENNKMQKIKYKKDLPESDTNYEFEFIKNKENSFDSKF